MNHPLKQSPLFVADVRSRFSWYGDNAGESVAWRFQAAVEATVLMIAHEPGLGRLRKFKSPELHGLQSFRIQPPFNKHLLFYRVSEGSVELWRLMHGARDLPDRLREPPN